MSPVCGYHRGEGRAVEMFLQQPSAVKGPWLCPVTTRPPMIPVFQIVLERRIHILVCHLCSGPTQRVTEEKMRTCA